MSTAEIHDYWQAGSCGTVYGSSPVGSPAFYEEVEAARYRLEPFIPQFAHFEAAGGQRVLEIGVGAATDFMNFARHGAELTGVDLTEAAVGHARARLEQEGLDAHLVVGSAEALPLAEGAFDLVYSWGVIHHAERPTRVIREAYRVLAPGGEVRAMLYGRRSWFALGKWARHALLQGRPWQSVSGVLAEHLESPGTQAYTRHELRLMFEAAGFDQVDVVGFLTPYDRRVAGPLARLIRLDWFLGVVGRKPDAEG